MAKQQDIKTSSPKKEKKKGIIRYEAIVPFFIVVAIIYFYFAIFFDTHARRLLEYGATRGNGAEVNIGHFKTSFFKASLDMGKIEITDGTKPTHNKFEIGQVKWNMLWDALLRGKIAIEDASILDIRLGTQRKRPGRVLPPDNDNSPGLADQVRQNALAKMDDESSGNVLGDIAAILGGEDPTDQLKNIQGSLQSEARIKQLQDELKKKEIEWKARIDALPNSKEIKEIGDRVKTVKTKDFKSPMEVQASLKQIDQIIKDADAKVKEVNSTSKALTGDVGVYQKAFADLDDMVKKDIEDLESRLKIPKLDAKSLSSSIVGPLFLDKVKQAEFYMNKARKMMPPKKTAEEKAAYAKPTPHERSNGRNYKFGRPKAYPLFWLQKGQISSQVTQSEWAGDFEGTLTNLTDDPPTIGVPTTFQFKGNFPKQNVLGIDGKLTIDHVTEVAREALTMKVASYGLGETKLLNSKEASVNLAKASVGSEFNGELKGDEVKIAMYSMFNNTDYQIAAKQKVLEDILKKVFAGLPQITMSASASGTWSNLKFDLNSNAGDELSAGFQREINAKIAEARAQLKAMIDQRIGGEKEKLTAQFKKIENQIKGALGDKQAEVDKAKGGLEETKKQASKEQGKKLENEGKKLLEGFKKKGFKF